MRSLIRPVAAVLGSVTWLGLLITTSFNPITVSIGLLTILLATSSSASVRTQHNGHEYRSRLTPTR